MSSDSAASIDSTHTPAEAEAFIPFILDDLVEKCLAEADGLSVDQHDAFREFCDLFSATTNFQSHRAMGSLDKDYAFFNPDSEMRTMASTRADREEAGDRVVDSFREIAENANYRRLSDEEIEASFSEQSLIKLRTAVDLDAFDKMECWVRGGDQRTHTFKNWKFQDIEKDVSVWRRVLLLMQFKEDERLTENQLKAKKKANLPYEPGKIYLYQYKDVPAADLEILFPNVRVSMNRKDQIMLGIPAVAATIGTIIKVGTKIVLVAGAVAYALTNTFELNIPFFEKEDFNAPEAKTLAIVVLGLLGALGGLFFKQYTSVKNKRIGFLKEVSEHLFFRNIAMNKAVFDRVIDDGEDEDCKEAMLVYYHLLTNRGLPKTRKTLDATIQDWMQSKLNVVIDFDIDGPVEKLSRANLLSEDAHGHLQALPLAQAKQALDQSWDNAFDFS